MSGLNPQPPFGLSPPTPFGLSPPTPFGLSLSKPCDEHLQPFDKLRANGFDSPQES